MKLTITLLFFAIFAFSAGANKAQAKKSPAKASGKRLPAGESCEIVLWTQKREFALEEAVNLFEPIPRDQLIRMMWAELTIDSQQPLYPIMLLYLTKTENNKLKRGYFKTILAMANDLSMEDVKRGWPMKVKSQYKWTVKDLCTLWDKTVSKAKL